ncbi:MAG: hypothetical protein ACRC7O_14960 [Fimbriiglobus sp.]
MTPIPRLLAAGFVLVAAAPGPVSAQTPAPNGGVIPAAAKAAEGPAELNFEDQFGRKAELASLRGYVTVLVYGDRKGTDACREYGEQLHVLFHPTAKGLSPEKARQAAVVPLAGVPDGKPSPDVIVVPVACASAPAAIRGFIKSQIAKASPTVTVWLDFFGVMEEKFGLRSGDVNLAVFDAAGRLRLKINGTPDAAAGQKFVQVIQNLRAEAAGLGK